MQLVDRRTYRGKHPEKRGGYVNDRTIVSINTPLALIRYMSHGFYRPIWSTRESFETWASHDVTDQLPAGCYMTWEQYQQQEQMKKLGIG